MATQTAEVTAADARSLNAACKRRAGRGVTDEARGCVGGRSAAWRARCLSARTCCRRAAPPGPGARCRYRETSESSPKSARALHARALRARADSSGGGGGGGGGGGSGLVVGRARVISSDGMEPWGVFECRCSRVRLVVRRGVSASGPFLGGGPAHRRIAGMEEGKMSSGLVLAVEG